MTAKKGTHSFSSGKQTKHENKHISLVQEIYDEFKCHDDKWDKRKMVTVAELIGEENVNYARHMTGNSNEIYSDGGVIFYDGKIVGLCEDKYQQDHRNSCERACKYQVYMDLKPNQIFLSCGGVGFEFDTNRHGGGATGTLYDIMKYRGYSIAMNETEQEFKTRLRNWFKGLL